jgi:5-methylcytosine-specific restriction endonuclease McrA
MLDEVLRTLPHRREEFERHLVTALLTRVAMLLIPRLDPSLSYNGMAKVTSKYLTELGLEEGEDFDGQDVEEIIETATYVRQAETGHRKDSWADLHYSEKKRLLDAQGGRCGVCGRTLVPGGAPTDKARPEIDHIVPFALRGNLEENKRVICGQCNRHKGVNLTFVNSDVVALNYFVKRLRRAEPYEIRFWVFERDESKCQQSGCTKSALDSDLTVRKVNSHGRYIFDNLRTICAECASGSAPREDRPVR